jgi:hypothetical protein
LASATVDPTSPSIRIPADFGGFSTYDVYDDEGTMGTEATGYNPIFRQLVKNLMFTGESFIISTEDDDGAAGGATSAPTANDVSTIGQLYLDLTGAGYDLKIIPGIAGLCTGNRALADAYGAAWIANLPRGALFALVMGNEPDGPCSIGYGPYLSRFQTYSADILALDGGSGLKFMGPQFGGQEPWVLTSGNMDSFVNSESSVLWAAGQHWYALVGCGNTPTLPQLLAPSAAIPSDPNLTSYVAYAHAHSVSFRISEMNSIDCGGTTGVSDVFAAALWILDALFNLANAGIDGVNIYWDEGVPGTYDLFGFTMSSAPYSWNANVGSGFLAPEYYGILVFQEATQNGATLIPCSVSTSANTTCWAVVDNAGVVRVVVNNKDLTAQGTVAVSLPGHGPATLKLLSAPAVTATAGVSYGGQTFDGSGDGTLQGTPNAPTITPNGGVYGFSLGPTEAALLTVQP